VQKTLIHPNGNISMQATTYKLQGLTYFWGTKCIL